MEDAPEVVRLLGCHLLRHLSTRRPADNVLVSPFGVVAVVSLAMAGAQRSTEREMAGVLMTKVPQFHKSMRRLLVLPSPFSPPPEEEAHVFRMANRILLTDTMPLSDSFRKIGERVYRTLVSQANFSRRAVDERKLINVWFECATGVKGALPASCPLDASTRMVLLSVVSLNMLWKHSFQRPTATLKPFGGGAVDVTTMCNTATYGYARLQEPALSALDIPLMCDGFSVTILLPQTSLQDLCENMTSEVLQQVFETVRTTRRRVRLELPRFTAEFETELSQVLQDLGIREAFTDAANFRTVTTSTPISLTWIVHKLALCVHEGVTPTVTPAEHGGPAIDVAPHELEFLVDRPFVICVRKLDILVLLGCVRRIQEA
ncbi:unnamed protein product, partial [Ixodes hexagonus]